MELRLRIVSVFVGVLCLMVSSLALGLENSELGDLKSDKRAFASKTPTEWLVSDHQSYWQFFNHYFVQRGETLINYNGDIKTGFEKNDYALSGLRKLVKLLVNPYLETPKDCQISELRWTLDLKELEIGETTHSGLSFRLNIKDGHGNSISRELEYAIDDFISYEDSWNTTFEHSLNLVDGSRIRLVTKQVSYPWGPVIFALSGHLLQTQDRYLLQEIEYIEGANEKEVSYLCQIESP